MNLSRQMYEDWGDKAFHRIISVFLWIGALSGACRIAGWIIEGRVKL